MTLVLTEASPFGIAMAADSSVTFLDGRSLLGVQKLIPARSLNAGISFWGAASIGKRQERMDVWLQRFINEKITPEITLWEVAEILADTLNKAHGTVLSINAGLHVAGYDLDETGEKAPAIYHVHNGHLCLTEDKNGRIVIQQLEPIREFRAHKDLPSGALDKDSTLLLKNGDFLLYNQLHFWMEQIIAVLQPKTGIHFPYPPTLETRGEYLRFWINLISQIYRFSNIFPQDLDIPVMGGRAHVGDPITVLTIDSQGIRSFYSV